MKLIGLSVNGLYGCYDYNVNFNTDVTFIYGMNGCGKTTILNITEAIITGQLFKLFNYRFKNIKLIYAKSKTIKNWHNIEIESYKQCLSVIFEEKKEKIRRLPIGDDIRIAEDNARELSHRYFERYEFLLKIKNTFNYVYLPLNRSIAPYYNEENYYYMQRYRLRMEREFALDKNSNDLAMTQIESLISYHYSGVSSKISNINDEFRNNILKSFLDFNKNYDLRSVLQEIDLENNSINDLKKIGKNYVKLLDELDLLTLDERKEFNSSFNSFINTFIEYNDHNDSSYVMELVLKSQEFLKIKKVLKMAEEMEQRKAKEMKPIETFINTMNEFISNSGDEKKIDIDNRGNVYFTTKYNKEKISIHHLSSGEKQLVTFFANLIFNVKNISSGIFVVDEPELSLHLSWQKIFINKVLEINKDIQLIFATHAPEIIGTKRNKMFKLEKHYVKVDDKNEWY